MKKTIIDLCEESVEKFGDNTFLWEKKTTVFEPITFNQTKEQVYRLAAGFIQMGVQSGDKIALLSEGRNDWITGELGILYAGATNVPLSIKLEESNDLIFRLQHSEARFIVISGKQLMKIRRIIDMLPLVEKIIIFDKQETYLNKEMWIGEILAAGDELLKTGKDVVVARSQAVQNDDLATITYTSGTTADPKGVMLSHRNYTANIEQALSLIDIEPKDSNLIIIPLDHCFGHVAGFYAFMAFGANVATVQAGKTQNETLRNIPLNIKEFQPSTLLSVPALAKNFRKNIETTIRKKGKMTEKLFNHALKVAYAENKEGFNKGGHIGKK
ncbi:MAG: AMP-binding protein, partial [Tannerella sp.]|nr:AMP-binding protein [Tannerella sp.]